MKPGDLFFRVGSALGAWFIAYAHGILIAVIPLTRCAGRETPEEIWLASFVLSIPAVGAALLLGLGLPWRDMLRWFSIPLIPLLLYSVFVAIPYLGGTTFGGDSLCHVMDPTVADAERIWWEPLWAPLQLALIAGFFWRCAQYWRTSDSAPA